MYKPHGWPTIIPKIVVNDAEGLTEFIRQVFEATGDYLLDRPTVMTIADSILMVSETGIRGATTAFLYVYVIDVDATYRRALDGGATSIEKPFDTPYGDRRCMVEDKWGNIWQIATYQKQEAL